MASDSSLSSPKPGGQATIGVPPIEVYFDEPRLRMTLWGRMAVRVVSYVGYLFFGATALLFLVSDIRLFRGAGLFLTLFLLDRLAHLREGDVPLLELLEKIRQARSASSGSTRALSVNVASYMAPQAYVSLERAFDHSILNGTSVYTELASQLLSHEDVADALRRLDVKPAEFRQKLEELVERSERGKPPSQARARDEDVRLLTVQSLLSALEGNRRFIEPADLFAVLPVVPHDGLKHLFTLFSIGEGDLARALIFSYARRMGSRWGASPKSVRSEPLWRKRQGPVVNRAWTSRPTPTLDKFSTDFTDLARRSGIGFLVGHKEDYERLVDALARPVNPNALLVGEPGVGKETITTHLAMSLVKDEVPETLFDKRLVELHLSTLVAGASQEELQRRLKEITDEIIIAGNVILYIPEIHNLVKTSGTAYLSVADALMPILMNNEFPVVGATYPHEFREYLEPRSDFLATFEVIRVEEINAADAEKILIYEIAALERKASVVVSFGAVKKAVVLAQKHFRNKLLPSSASDLLKDSLAEALRRGDSFVAPEHVIAAAETKSKVPIHEATKEEAEALLHVEDIIHKRLINQEEAVQAVADALREFRSGLARPGGPIGSFLFVGPTGVGKTELAKTLAAIQFGDESAMVRFDMTEFQDPQSVNRFIGSPDGAVSGALTDAVREKPYSLVLLDEFEKAHPSILNVFLQVLDDGRLTDHLGRTVDFQNTIIVATSNAHSDIINDAVSQGKPMVEIADYLKKRLVDVFKPELVNRFSRIIVFKDLSPQDLEKVVSLRLVDLARSAEGRGVKLLFDQEVVRKIAHMGYDPAFGARPLRRVIEEKLRAPLAKELLKQEVGRGSVLRVVVEGDVFSFMPMADEKKEV